MADKSSSTSTSIGFSGLLTVVFITLKLLGKIAWSWWWVFSPLWIEVGIEVGAVLVIMAVGILLVVMHEVFSK